MNNQQLDLFAQTNLPNPLKDRHVCLAGDFRIPTKQLYEELIAIGAKGKRKDNDKSETDTDEEIYRFEPTKYINFFVVGNNPKEDTMKRIALNVHDGFRPKIINEETLYKYLNGHFSQEDIVPKDIEKQLNLDISYYNWTAPTIKGNTFVSRVSSPLQYDSEGNLNPISQKEIYVPTIPGIDMSVFYQIIGNLGGYANGKYYEDTNMILLSDETLFNLQNGIKDRVILDIENMYNMSNARIFNIQFTSESDFIKWVKRRMIVFPDNSTISYLKKYEEEKSSITK